LLEKYSQQHLLASEILQRVVDEIHNHEPNDEAEDAEAETLPHAALSSI